MIIYNITVKVDAGIDAAWLLWQREVHIPEIMASGKFIDYKLCRLLEQDETDGITYVTQFTAATEKEYREYIDSYAPLLRQKAFDTWGNGFVAFRSLMEVIH